MFNKTIQNYKKSLANLQQQNLEVDMLIKHEEVLYLDSKETLEKSIINNTSVDNLQVNMLTFTPDLSLIKDKDIKTLIDQL